MHFFVQIIIVPVINNIKYVVKELSKICYNILKIKETIRNSNIKSINQWNLKSKIFFTKFFIK